MPDLFVARADIATRTEPIQGELAEYVLNEMPAQLEQVHDGEVTYGQLAETHQIVIDHSIEDIHANSERAQALVHQLDLLFLMGCYLPRGSEAFADIPPVLGEVIDTQAERYDLPRRMTYELIIDVNTTEFLRTGRIRTFTRNQIGMHERDFYRGHVEAEDHLKVVFGEVKTLLDGEGESASDVDLTNAIEHFKGFDDVMLRYAKLPREGFDYFRQYITTYPDGVRNASGAFMPTVQMLELILHPPTDQQLVFINESMPYFPMADQPVIRELVQRSQEGENILQKMKDGSLSLTNDQVAQLAQVVTTFADFKHRHMTITRRKIPGAFGQDAKLNRSFLAAAGERPILDADGLVEGTAGFHVEHVLGNGVARLLGLLDQLGEA